MILFQVFFFIPYEFIIELYKTNKTMAKKISISELGTLFKAKDSEGLILDK